jgi:hypothetical protein
LYEIKEQRKKAYRVNPGIMPQLRKCTCEKKKPTEFHSSLVLKNM